ncbi:MAG: mannose-6-phosphate isomerase, class I [Thermodesulfobacteriota bacterium]
MNKIVRLHNPVKTYAWGSETAIPELIGIPVVPGRPVAEWWIGAHPLGPSDVECNGGRIRLDHWIAENPEGYLGHRVCSRFGGNFPFLLKVLAATHPLSIQVHPDKNEAAAGFLRENESGIPLDDPKRTFKDPNPKPECVCALTPFWVMYGFQPIEAIQAHFEPFAVFLADESLHRSGPIPDRLRGFLKSLLEMDPQRKQGLLMAVRGWIERHPASNAITEWVPRLMQAYPEDIGSLAPLFMNVAELQPGEALYLPPKTLHAYLEGMAIEIMVNSDNVVRGGLTPKHIDIPTLLDIVNFGPNCVEVQHGSPLGTFERVYRSPEESFRLSRIELSGDASAEFLSTGGIEVYLCTEGSFHVSEWPTSSEGIRVRKGESFLVTGDCPGIRMKGSGTMFKAFVPGS